jgi:hypothetical protein
MSRDSREPNVGVFLAGTAGVVFCGVELARHGFDFGVVMWGLLFFMFVLVAGNSLRLRFMERKRGKRLELMRRELREEIAACTHTAWAGWMQYLIGSRLTEAEARAGGFLLSGPSVECWRERLLTAYADLPGDAKITARREADKILTVIEDRMEAFDKGVSSSERIEREES